MYTLCLALVEGAMAQFLMVCTSSRGRVTVQIHQYFLLQHGKHRDAKALHEIRGRERKTTVQPTSGSQTTPIDIHNCTQHRTSSSIAQNNCDQTPLTAHDTQSFRRPSQCHRTSPLSPCFLHNVLGLGCSAQCHRPPPLPEGHRPSSCSQSQCFRFSPAKPMPLSK